LILGAIEISSSAGWRRSGVEWGEEIRGRRRGGRGKRRLRGQAVQRGGERLPVRRSRRRHQQRRRLDGHLCSRR
jgi:hypothetical protein